MFSKTSKFYQINANLLVWLENFDGSGLWTMPPKVELVIQKYSQTHRKTMTPSVLIKMLASKQKVSKLATYIGPAIIGVREKSTKRFSCDNWIQSFYFPNQSNPDQQGRTAEEKYPEWPSVRRCLYSRQ